MLASIVGVLGRRLYWEGMTMKVRGGLAGLGAALVLVLAGQAAQAQSCPAGGEGGGVTQTEVPGEGGGCLPLGGYTTVETQGVDATGASYDAELVLEGQDEELEIGAYVEVEIDLDTIEASLRANPKAAATLASSIGVRTKIEVDGANIRSSKLSDGEYSATARYVSVALQNRARGQSDPATSGNRSRVEHLVQAFERLVSSVSSGIRNAIMPNVKLQGREREVRQGNTVTREREFSLEIS